VILDLIYNSPTWLWGTIVILLITGVSCGGLALFHWMVHLELRRTHNELTGFTVAVISVTYAVLLAFIAIATWESFTEAAQMVDNEADYVGSIYRDTQGLPANVGEDIRVDARDYIKTVIDKEWPTQQAGRTPSAGWKPLREIHSDIVTMRPTTLGEAVIQAELLKTLNGLYRARASRLAAAEGHIPTVIWWIISFGAALTIGYTYLFGFHDFRMHLATTGSVAISLGLVIVLIISLDWPFRGQVSISPDAFVKVQQSWSDLSFEKP
jgi:hypothetical protein